MSDHPSVLSSWKDIAQYMGKGVRTVQRWEAELGLPVRRPQGRDRQIVLAVPEELDEWLRRQSHSTKYIPRRTADDMHAQLARMQQLIHTVHRQAETALAQSRALSERLEAVKQTRDEKAGLVQELRPMAELERTA